MNNSGGYKVQGFMNSKNTISLILITVCFLFPGWVNGQITAPGSDATDLTSYPTFPETDNIFIFCTTDSLAEIGSLQAATQLSGSKTYQWEKYNSNAAAFETFSSEISDHNTSEISILADGCYRVTITQGGNTEIYRAWVFNNWTVANGSVTESNCEYFTLSGEFFTADFNYYDLADNSKIQIPKENKFEWKEGEEIHSFKINATIYDPPTKDTEYTFRVYDDKYGCEGITTVTYFSIVTKAVFTVDKQNGEAPLTVNFNNQSENGDSGQFRWYLFRDIDEIKREAEQTGGIVDSIMIVAFDDDPVYTYERTGIYDVKLVSSKTSEFSAQTITCADTVYIDELINVDSSFVAAPNVFTPNGDGTNDNFVVKFWSMESIDISIFNRWGKRVHYWKGRNIQGFEGAWTATVWDGRLMGGRFASPGVYFYNVEGMGRDGVKRKDNGFVHLFRGKD